MVTQRAARLSLWKAYDARHTSPNHRLGWCVCKGSLPLLIAGTAIVGLTGGAANHMTNYLMTRYGGLAHFGKIFGMMASLMGLAGGVAPLLAAMIFDATGSYDPYLFAGMGLAVVGGILVGTPWPFTRFAQPAAATA